MSKKFAFKLVNQHNGSKFTERTLDKSSHHSEDACISNPESSPRVNVFTMTDEAQNDEQLVIIHIPKKNDDNIKDRALNSLQPPLGIHACSIPWSLTSSWKFKIVIYLNF